MTGGTNGSRAFAIIEATNGSQSVTGVGLLRACAVAPAAASRGQPRLDLGRQRQPDHQRPAPSTCRGGSGYREPRFLFADALQNNVGQHDHGTAATVARAVARRSSANRPDHHHDRRHQLTGGAKQGAPCVGNTAILNALGSQTIVVGNGGLNLFAGGGTGSDTDNAAYILQGDKQRHHARQDAVHHGQQRRQRAAGRQQFDATERGRLWP